MGVEGDKFGRWIGMSLLLHLGLVSVALIWPSLLTLRGDSKWGSNTGGTDGIKVQVATGIPGIALPSPEVVQQNAVANESKGLYRSQPEPEPKAKPEEKKVDDAAAIAIPDETVKTRPEPAKPKQIAKAVDTPPPANAVPYGQGGRPAMEYGQFSTGAGEAGIKFGDGAFGDAFGWYVAAIQRTISSNWLRATIDTNVRAAPRVYMSFTIARDGMIVDPKIEQSSGIPSLDASAQRAIARSNPLQALPREYRGSTVEVKVYFEYIHQ
jgi:TonB family protein